MFFKHPLVQADRGTLLWSKRETLRGPLGELCSMHSTAICRPYPFRGEGGKVWNRRFSATQPSRLERLFLPIADLRDGLEIAGAF
jgi:hypothetical protein